MNVNVNWNETGNETENETWNENENESCRIWMTLATVDRSSVTGSMG